MQLNHEEKEDGDGWTEIALDGEVLARHEDVQHNRNYDARENMLEDMANQAIAKYLNSKGAE